MKADTLILVLDCLQIVTSFGVALIGFFCRIWTDEPSLWERLRRK